MLYSWIWKIIILVEINYFFASKLYLEYFCHIYKYLVRLQIRDCMRKIFLIFNYLFFSTYQFAFKISIFRNSNSRKEMISLCNLSLRSSNTYHQMRTVKKCAVFGNLRKKPISWLHTQYNIVSFSFRCFCLAITQSYTYRTESKLKTELVVLIWHWGD